MILKRKIYDKLLDWKINCEGKVALLIEGARRVGKSFIVKEFAENEYTSYILIDFFTASDEVKDLFLHYLDDLDTFFLYLSTYYNVKLTPRESLIIFDEVQLFPRARAAIKYLVADGRYDYIETGSLISIRTNIQNILIPSEERRLKMYPLDFEEFLWAMGNDTLMDTVRLHFSKMKPMGQALNRKAMSYFNQYVIVGGMPQSVLEYIQTKDFNKVDESKRDILTLYRSDIVKYARRYQTKVESVFDEIPAQLSKHEKVFRLSSLGKQARMRTYEDAFTWLDDAMIINPCYNSTEPNIGLKMNMDRTTMKCYMGDTGLLISHAFDENGIVTEEIYKKLLFGKLEVNEGMIMENVIAQMLTASRHELYFFSNYSKEDKDERMEIDFLISKNKVTDRHNISPIEVKSGKGFTLSSLTKFKKKYAEQTFTPYVVHTGDLNIDEGITYIPLYMVPCL